jgi:hypothetical protein
MHSLALPTKAFSIHTLCTTTLTAQPGRIHHTDTGHTYILQKKITNKFAEFIVIPSICVSVVLIRILIIQYVESCFLQVLRLLKEMFQIRSIPHYAKIMCLLYRVYAKPLVTRKLHSVLVFIYLIRK